eukprot:scaffold3886_cov399-Prasinococcus_capsulatus_cf.AAC.33
MSYCALRSAARRRGRGRRVPGAKLAAHATDGAPRRCARGLASNRRRARALWPVGGGGTLAHARPRGQHALGGLAGKQPEQWP